MSLEQVIDWAWPKLFAAIKVDQNSRKSSDDCGEAEEAQASSVELHTCHQKLLELEIDNGELLGLFLSIIGYTHAL